MLKGVDLLEKVKYEIIKNADYSTKSVRIPIDNLNLLIELAEENQYRLDLEMTEKIFELMKKGR